LSPSEPGGGGDVSAGIAGANRGADGSWTVTGGSEAGYRVKEVLFGQSTEAVPHLPGGR
jgi:hypothetical protein